MPFPNPVRFLFSLAHLFSFALCLLTLPMQAATVGNPADPAGLPAAIQSAYAAGSRKIVLTPGKYTLPGGTDRASLTIRNLKNAEVDAYKVELAMTDLKDCVVFENCQNVVFRGATVHYAVPHTGQGKILALGSDTEGNYYDVQLDAGYPQDADFKGAYIIDPVTRHFKPGNSDMTAKSVTPLDVPGLTAPGKVRLRWDGDYGLPKNHWNVAVGDYVVCRGPGNTMLKDDGCDNCTFQDLMFYWGGVFGFFDIGGGRGNRFLHDTITYGPKPPGAVNAPLLSQSADGLHSPDARVGPDIERCLFEGNCDDGFAIHGYYEPVAASIGTSLTVKPRGGSTMFGPGEPIRVQNDKTGFIADATVTAAAPAPDSPGAFVLTLDKPINAPDGSLAADPARCGRGYKIIGNTVRNHRARGMLLKADDGLVQGNLVDGSTIAGIVVSPEAPDEAGYSHHVRIIGNTLRNTGYATTGSWAPYAAAVTIYGNGSIGNQDIVIAGNTFDSIHGANLEVRYARGVTIRSNRFLNTHQMPCDNGSGPGIDPAAVAWLGDCADVTLSDNWVRNQGPYGKHLLTVTPSAVNVNGGKTGIQRAVLRKK